MGRFSPNLDRPQAILIQIKYKFPANLMPQGGRFSVERKRFSVGQIVVVVKGGEAGVPLAELLGRARL
jgi:hypothetical protein